MKYSSKQIIDWGNYLNNLDIFPSNDSGLRWSITVGNLHFKTNTLNEKELLDDLNKYYNKALTRQKHFNIQVLSLDQFIISERDNKLNQLLQ